MKKFLYTISCLVLGGFTIQAYIGQLNTPGSTLYYELSSAFAILLCLAASTWEKQFCSFKTWVYKHSRAILTLLTIALFFFLRYLGQIADKDNGGEIIGVYLIIGMLFCSVLAFACIGWLKLIPFFRPRIASVISNLPRS